MVESNLVADIDSVKWSTAPEKAQAAEKLAEEYHASPMMLPVLEATGDKKSFGFRPERSTLDAHACVLETLKGHNASCWIVSPYLGNFVLDGLQSCIYLGLKDSRKKDDYADENTIRFADDVIVTVRSKKKAQMHCGIFVRARQLIIALPMCRLRNSYALPDNKAIKLIRLEDAVLLEALLADEKNMFKPRTWKYLPLTDYFERLEKIAGQRRLRTRSFF